MNTKVILKINGKSCNYSMIFKLFCENIKNLLTGLNV